MALKKFKPTTPGRRWMTGIDYKDITSSTPNKALTVSLKKAAGRNNTGRITIRHQGGGHAKKYRLVDFYMTDKKSIPAKVETIEYDPYRSAFIALVCYNDGERRYVLAHSEVTVGDTIVTDEKAPLKSGNRMEIGNIPVGLKVHNIELIVGQGASSVRAAGSSAQVVSQEGEYTLIIHMVVEKDEVQSVWKLQKLHGGKLLSERKQETKRKQHQNGFSEQEKGNSSFNYNDTPYLIYRYVWQEV